MLLPGRSRGWGYCTNLLPAWPSWLAWLTQLLSVAPYPPPRPHPTALNMSVFMLIGRSSALTMNIAGVVKDWLLIMLSVLLYKYVPGDRGCLCVGVRGGGLRV